jgi:Uma2 family endonuclease
MAIVDATMTPAEFLLWEEAQDEKHEFLGGSIVEMPGVNSNHSVIATNVRTQASLILRPRRCLVYDSDFKIEIPGGSFLYPDASFVCDPKFADEKQLCLLNPKVIVEILSDSTEHRDRTEKFDAYATIPSMDEYFLIASDERRVERFQRRNDGWWLTISRGSEIVRSDALDFELSLDDIYALVL